ncbi:MAG: hypothetical protein EZS28_033235 [Streblomastix strix]|uniref:Uncharacterized protein n=1 Tax=Streblomastix strix TaxID=222440 RepID=A0A5J4ULD8_9EUKA|nr:MAG: hypothetical protein EZS28_033235 [Streblomastix strix]
MNRILNVEKILKLNEMTILNEILNVTLKQNIILNVNVIANDYFDIQMNVCGDLYNYDVNEKKKMKKECEMNHNVDDDDDDALKMLNNDAMNVNGGYYYDYEYNTIFIRDTVIVVQLMDFQWFFANHGQLHLHHESAV